MKIFTAQQMRDFDRAAIEDYGIPSIVLMENAALRVVEFLEAKFAPLSGKKIVILCGKGNNGGDGLAIARHLSNLIGEMGEVRIVSLGFTGIQGDAKTNLEIARNEGFIHVNDDFDKLDNEDDPFTLPTFFFGTDIILDAIYGTGFHLPMSSETVELLHLRTYGKVSVAVDLPSGLNSDTGEAARATSADYTVTFAAPKRGFFVRDGIEKCGEVWIGDIGSSPTQMEETQTGAQTLDLQSAKQYLPRRNADAHKGDAGRALVVGGSFGMSGSICLAARAALASGAGLVAAALPEKVLPIFAGAVLEATSHPLPCDESGHISNHAAAVAALWDGMQVVALGPGLGRTHAAQEFARQIARDCPAPLLVDADALHALPAIAEQVKARTAPTILTPHPGEMGVLMNSSAKNVNDARFETVAACAQKYGAIVVLKGARTLVCDAQGEIWVNLTGNAGMATGGSGDVLTGTIAGLLAQLKDADNATKLGVYLHGMAGDIAARTRGNGLVAGDIAAHLPDALLEIETREVQRINGRLRKLE